MPDSSSVFEHLQVYDLQMCMHLLKNLMEDGGRGEGRERERREREREREIGWWVGAGCLLVVIYSYSDTKQQILIPAVSWMNT